MNHHHPTEISSCKLADHDCIKKSLQEKFPSLHNPSKNKEFPLIDPFFFDLGETVFNRSTVRGSFTIKNMTIIGGSSLKFQDVQTSTSGGKVSVVSNVVVPKVFASGWYKSDLTVSSFKFVSRGKFNVTMEDISAKFTMTGKLNSQRFTVESFEMQPKVANMKFHLTGLLKDAELSKNLISDFRVLEIIKILIADKIVNQFVNEAWKQIYQDLVAAAKPSWGPIALALVKEDFSFIKIIS